MKTLLGTFFAVTIFTSPLASQEQWFPLKIAESTEKVEFCMAHWLHKPAGKHGFVQIDGDRFVFEDGTPVKF
jgi:hypothetical protein